MSLSIICDWLQKLNSSLELINVSTWIYIVNKLESESKPINNNINIMIQKI